MERDVVLRGFDEGYGLALIIGRLMEGREPQILRRKRQRRRNII